MTPGKHVLRLVEGTQRPNGGKNIISRTQRLCALAGDNFFLRSFFNSETHN